MKTSALLGLALLFLGTGHSTFADDLDDQLDAAQVQAKAGKLDRALTIVTSLAAVHRVDPRVHYFRYVYLKELGRWKEAADALETAERTLESFKKRGDKNPSVSELEPSIAKEGNEILANRRMVQKVLQTYRAKALDILKGLKTVEEPFVLYIVEEVYRATPSDPEELLAIWGRTTAENRSAYEERKEKVRKAALEKSSPDLKLLKENLSQAEAALKGGNYREAKVSASAALEIFPRNVPALVLLSEALWNLDKNEESARAAVEAIDAPKATDDEAMKAGYDRAVRQVHNLSPKGLEPFVALRADTAQDILRIRDQARAAKKEHDVDWIEREVARLAPGDPAVARSVDKVRFSEEVNREIPLLGKVRPTLGFVDLLSSPQAWNWRNKVDGCSLTDGVLHFKAHDGNLIVEAFPKDFWLKPAFSLRFKITFDIERGQEPWFYVILSAGPESGNEGNAIIFFPQGDHTVAFASRRTGTPWGLRKRRPLPKDKAVPGEWSQIEVVWNNETKRFLVTIEDEPAIDGKLEPKETLHGLWSFGFAGKAKEFLVKEVLLKNEE